MSEGYNHDVSLLKQQLHTKIKQETKGNFKDFEVPNVQMYLKWLVHVKNQSKKPPVKTGG